ncbi:LysM peptidoglycan-binding domain-containing protein [Georgenia alba]|uniref:LysM peptidoglycan-binding domain-containing protein n=1 Tax=Georgenia alba TaxID=2233858 RepID=A0ABW2Q7F8_9MICO
MSALTVHPVAPFPSRAPRRKHLQLVGPGFVPRPAPARAPKDLAEPGRARCEAPSTGLRLTRRGRRAVATLALLAAGSVSVAVGSWAALATQPAGLGETATVTVAPGESLWSVAQAEADPGEDVRDVVARIAELNGLSSSGVHAGQQLQVPRG